MILTNKKFYNDINLNISYSDIKLQQIKTTVKYK